MHTSSQWAQMMSHLAKGTAIGAANTVPGVSGGTIAVVTGIYDRLVEAIGDLLSSRWRQHLRIVAPVLIGAVIGIAAFAWVIEVGLERAPEQTFFVFVGLIAGSIPFVAGQVREHPVRPHHVVLFGAAVAILVVQAIVGEPPMSAAIAEVDLTTAVPLLLAGAVATATMIIPGVSGSFVLLVIGMYTTFLQAVRTANIPVLAVLIVGAAVGLVGASKVMSLLLRRFHAATYWVILGLVTGSIVGIWPAISSWQSALADVAAVAVGAGLAMKLGKRPRTDTTQGETSTDEAQ